MPSSRRNRRLACDLPRCQFGFIVIHNTNTLYAAISTRLKKNATVQRAVAHLHEYLHTKNLCCCSRLWFLACSYHQPRQNCLCVGSTSTQQLFSYTCVSKTASDVTEARRLDQEAVLLYLSVTACDHCFGNSHRRSQMTGTDFSRVVSGVSPSWHPRYQLPVWPLSCPTPIGVTPSHRPHHASLTAQTAVRGVNSGCCCCRLHFS